MLSNLWKLISKFIHRSAEEEIPQDQIWARCATLIEEMNDTVLVAERLMARGLKGLPSKDPWASKVAEIERDLIIVHNRLYNLTQFFGALHAWRNNSPFTNEGKRNDSEFADSETNQEAEALDRDLERAREAKLRADILRTTPSTRGPHF